MHAHKRGVVGSKRDEIGVESSGSVQIWMVCPILGVSLLITISSQNSSRGVSLRHGSTKQSSFNRPSESSSTTLTSCLEVSPVYDPVHYAKGRGEISKVEALTVVSIGVLEKDGATHEKEVNEGSDTSSKSVKGASSTILDSRGREGS